ncbi:hypothetical protein HDU92_002633 [Lobulomyces angularis]|nr:hypothetical protein HDU92_002633 [Lobulomyces angularis]
MFSRESWKERSTSLRVAIILVVWSLIQNIYSLVTGSPYSLIVGLPLLFLHCILGYAIHKNLSSVPLIISIEIGLNLFNILFDIALTLILSAGLAIIFPLFWIWTIIKVAVFVLLMGPLYYYRRELTNGANVFSRA